VIIVNKQNRKQYLCSVVKVRRCRDARGYRGETAEDVVSGWDAPYNELLH